jgi:nitrite reductase (NO-forming)
MMAAMSIRSVRSKLAGAVLVVACAVGGAAVAPAGAAVVQVRLTARPAVVKVAPGVHMRAWTYNGKVPAPTIRVHQGDIVQVTLHNGESRRSNHGHGMFHSVDFHAAQIAPDVGFASIGPGKTHTFSFVAEHAGVFLYHCGSSPMLEHVGMGMYGAIIVDPAVPRPPATEITLVQSEFYGTVRHGRLHSGLQALRREQPRFVAFNGTALRYAMRPITVPTGGLVRIYLVDAGPSLDSDFHVVGSMFDTVEPDGNPANALHDVSTQLVPAGGAAVFELHFPQPGTYPFVTHSLRAADAGAMGRFVAR